VEVFLWTGNCRPPEEAIEIVDKLGIYNMNGGDSRWDPEFPSCSYVAPFVRSVGNRKQVFATSCNENIYTDGWQDTLFGFKHVLHTYRNTESPRRLLPINVYYHFYSGEKIAATKALHEVYTWVLKQDIHPLFASEYLAVVQGFQSAKIDSIAGNGWKIRDYGKCQTVRIDDTDLTVDLDSSKNILGYKKINRSLYIHLGQGKEATIYLSSTQSKVHYVEQSSVAIKNWTVSNDSSFSFETVCLYGKGRLEIVGLKAGAVFVLELTVDSKPQLLELKSDTKGKLLVTVPRSTICAISAKVK